MEKEAEELELPPISVRGGTRHHRKRSTAFQDISPEQFYQERSNSSRKRKTAALSLFYPPPRPQLKIIKPSPKLEIGFPGLNGDVPVKLGTCKCKQSCCLKMYCLCFASGKYCDGCSCFDCQNSAENEDARQASLRSILERDNRSLRKMLMRSAKFSVYEKDGGKENLIWVNSVGCCCKRSQCIQGYCVCFQVNKFCSETCKCINCQNVKSCKSISSSEPRKYEDENILGSNGEDQLNCTLGQNLKTVSQATPSPLNSSYRSLLADIIQLQNLMEFCKLLMVTSEAEKRDSKGPFNLENAGHERELHSAVAFVDDQSSRPGVHSSEVQADMHSPDSKPDDCIQKERPMSPEIISLVCDEKDMLFTPDASYNMIQSGFPYMEHEKLILVKFLDFLNCLINCGNAKELELAARMNSQKDVLHNLKGNNGGKKMKRYTSCFTDLILP